MKKEGTFFQRNAVLIIMLPVLGALHYGWNALQKNEILVPKHEQRHLQLYDWYLALKKSLSNEKS